MRRSSYLAVRSLLSFALQPIVKRFKRPQPAEQYGFLPPMVSYLRVYAGPSLTNENEDPIEICFDEASCAGLEARDPICWAVLIELIQRDLGEVH